jgi:hypothetical protein
MQFVRSDRAESGEFRARPARTVLCDHCRTVLGEKRVLTRDVEGHLKRFCGEDGVCLEAWQRHHQSVFRRR